jgi:hypothetical protein
MTLGCNGKTILDPREQKSWPPCSRYSTSATIRTPAQQQRAAGSIQSRLQRSNVHLVCVV